MCASVSSVGKILNRASDGAFSGGCIVPCGMRQPCSGSNFTPPKAFGDDCAVDRLGRMTGPPADDVTAQTGLREDIPERFAFARSARVRARAAVDRIGLDETVDAVLVCEFSGRDRIPEHGRENRLERGQISHHAAIDQPVERWHQTFLQQRSDVFPISRIPTNEEDFSFPVFSHELEEALRAPAN